MYGRYSGDSKAKLSLECLWLLGNEGHGYSARIEVKMRRFVPVILGKTARKWMRDKYQDYSAPARAKLCWNGVSLWWARSEGYGSVSRCVLEFQILSLGKGRVH